MSEFKITININILLLIKSKNYRTTLDPTGTSFLKILINNSEKIIFTVFIKQTKTIFKDFVVFCQIISHIP